jgi:hypothetical protein
MKKKLIIIILIIVLVLSSSIILMFYKNDFLKNKFNFLIIKNTDLNNEKKNNSSNKFNNDEILIHNKNKFEKIIEQFLIDKKILNNFENNEIEYKISDLKNEFYKLSKTMNLLSKEVETFTKNQYELNDKIQGISSSSSSSSSNTGGSSGNNTGSSNSNSDDDIKMNEKIILEKNENLIKELESKILNKSFEKLRKEINEKELNELIDTKWNEQFKKELNELKLLNNQYFEKQENKIEELKNSQTLIENLNDNNDKLNDNNNKLNDNEKLNELIKNQLNEEKQIILKQLTLIIENKFKELNEKQNEINEEEKLIMKEFILNKIQTLEKQLDEQMRIFINDKSKNTIAADKAKVSSLFKWFSGDFEDNAPSVIAFINNYSTVKINPDADISYQDYNWNLNEAK